MQTVPLKHIRVADQVADTLLDWLRTGALARGARLPAERELAAHLGVSRSSLRGALQRLELLGHLEVRPGDGTYARTPDAETLARPFRDLLSALPEPAEALLEFRLLLEPEVAALAARRLDAAGAAELRASLARQRAVGADSARMLREDLLFHDTLARLAGNAVVLQVLDTLRAVLRDLRATALSAADPAHTLEDHARIAEAVLAHDPDGARAAMREHLGEVVHTHRSALHGAAVRAGGAA